MNKLIEPVVIFDFEGHRVQQIDGDPTRERLLAEALAAQRELVATATGTPPPEREEPAE